MTTDWKDILAGLQSNETDGLNEHTSDTGNLDKTASENSSEASASLDTAAHPALTVFYEKKGRAGKPSTILTGFDADDESSLRMADELAATLKKRLGCGGSARGGEILLQGDRRQQLRPLLTSLGYKRLKGI
ncbi:MAG: translation initiation factor [Muribaculaceae bacterium]|nr:translation initiation factor [Muribaculaceae bacterium]